MSVQHFIPVHPGDVGNTASVGGTRGKVRGSIIHLLGTMDMRAKCHGNLANSYIYFSLDQSGGPTKTQTSIDTELARLKHATLLYWVTCSFITKNTSSENSP